MNDKRDSLEDILDLSPSSVVEEGSSVPIVYNPASNSAQDYDYARDNIRLVIETGLSQLEVMKDLAAKSQHPKMFEVFISMLKTVTDSNKTLLDLKKVEKQIQKLDDTDKPTMVQNNLFVGTTADLQRMIEGDDD